MTRDHINMLLNVSITASNTQVWTITQEQLERFAALVAAAEREACIDIVSMHGGSVEIEAAIRARGQV
jgi:poly-gamma-glutamate capsule biosynthesis protein CapA/YwtB (metallophosphatase superfamily)